MSESRATIPDFSLTVKVDMDAAVALRRELSTLGLDHVPSYNDFVVRASALALRTHPAANASYRDEHFEHHARVNVGIAVSRPGELIVPTVLDADRKSLVTIAAETRSLAVRVRENTITPSEISGATFTVSNLGMYGITEFAAIVNPPQSAILAVGAIEPELVMREDRVRERQVMRLTLSCDHRILYGAQAAEFLAAIRNLLQTPLQLLT